MYDIAELYRLAQRQNILVSDFSMGLTSSMSIMTDSGNCYIGMDSSTQDGGAKERVHLAHELGHCLTGSFYNKHAAIDSRHRHENRADKWAILQLVPIDELDEAIAEGDTESWELAERFGVSEQFIKKAICLYVHGNVAEDLYF